MEQYKKEANATFFMNVLNSLNENGIYVYPDIGENFQKMNGCLVGTKYGIDKIKEITPVSFHQYLVVRTDLYEQRS